ncbi:MAG TPA: MaoC family dehydratase N-terminal domain-containing protein [Mycobacteriales bacterium]|jgi:acyl dehydratase|nr:MaoC family dehydratase N-terminal domain-containing protein [Mycobacteriales bacterium]
MALDQRFVGRSYGPGPVYEVGREKIREFADAIGDTNEAYRDPGVARKLGHPDVIAPPTFPIIVSMRASAELVADPELGLDYSRVVHGEQRFTYTRPVRAGDRLVSVLTVDSIRSAAGNDILGTRAELSTEEGEHVVTAYSTIVARGTAR